MIELLSLDPPIRLDIRYAREDNFVGRAVYSEARAFLQPDAAEALVRAHRSLAGEGLGLVIYDGYRPWSVTKLFWDFVTEEQRKYVADPAEGSVHNRGCAVDLSLCELATGRQLPMPSDFDEFTERASPNYAGGTDEERRNRDRLRRAMESHGFTVNANEWWHFDLAGWKKYPIMDIPFSECSAQYWTQRRKGHRSSLCVF